MAVGVSTADGLRASYFEDWLDCESPLSSRGRLNTGSDSLRRCEVDEDANALGAGEWVNMGVDADIGAAGEVGARFVEE